MRSPIKTRYSLPALSDCFCVAGAHMKQVLRVVSAALIAALVLSGCATTSPGSLSAGPRVAKAAYPVSKQTAMQRAIGGCVASVGIGAVAGAFLGAATGRNVGGTALLGAAVGAGACAALLYLADKEDQAQVAALERQAVVANASQTQTFTTKKNTQVLVKTTIAQAPIPPQPKGMHIAPPTNVAMRADAPPDPAYRDCRYATQQVDAGGASATSSQQLWCSTLDTGDWLPLDA